MAGAKRLENIKDKSVVNINEHKEDRSLSRYFNILSFNDLIREANDTISEINGGELTKATKKKSLFLLKEFKLRLKAHMTEEIL